MTHFLKLKASSFLKWVSTVFVEKHLGSSKSNLSHTSRGFCTGRFPILIWVSTDIVEKHLRSSKSHLFHTSGGLYTGKYPFWYGSGDLLSTRASLLELSPTPPYQTLTQNSRSARTQAQAALLDYFHCTRCLHFIDAEHMSMNSPSFLQKLLKRIKNEQEIRHSLTKFLLYHPINEFEPFFESLGLKESEVSQLLPHNSMFLCDNHLLVDNVHTLCDYGIPRSSVGKMYVEEKEIFGYEHGVLDSKLLAYEGLGFSKSSVLKLVVTSPSLLTEGDKGQFVKMLKELKSMGIERDWIIEQLSVNNTYNWSRMLAVLQFFSEMGHSKEELGGLFTRHSDLLLDGSGDGTYSLTGLLLKLGIAMNDIVNLFLQLPQIQVGVFTKNLRQGLIFLIEIGLEAEDIIKIMHSHLQVLGSSPLKKPNTVLGKLNVGKTRLCRIIKEDPSQLRNWVFGSKISPLPKPTEDQRLMKKTAFLVRLGFAEESDEMKNALKLFRGKSAELQERFDCIVKAGLKPNDVSNMIRTAPQVLNQSRNMIEKKIDFLVKNLGFPVESLVEFPYYLSYTVERVKLRFLMYEWLKCKGKVRPMLALSTILAYSDNVFTLQFVNRHPEGPVVWENFKKALSLC
ncbi:hypothetical protein AAC387_Pa03g3999 [Persea americana]